MLQCSASWHNAQEAQSAGISVGTVIYGVPLSIGANWSDQTIQAWKSRNCSDAEKSGDFFTTLNQTSYSIDPINAKYVVDCVKAKSDNRALRCDIVQTNNSLLFEVQWRRSAGETNDAAPAITSFFAVNTTCLHPDEVFKKDTKISDGGISLLCIPQAESAAFSLNTTRGDCYETSKAKAPKIQLPISMQLTAPFFQSADDLEIASGTKIVTNGFPFTLRAGRLTILGPSQIVSFDDSPPAPMAPGRTASSVDIVADEVIGQGLSILNAGSPGGPGTVGTQGPPGPPGAPGQSRTPQWANNCPGGILNPVCQLAFLGCGGGQDGAPGKKGGPGFTGNPGSPGGGAGEVKIEAPLDAKSAFLVLTDVSVAGQHQACGGQICGGIGGIGGPGGPGGTGGPGGIGAPGSAYCGGTNAGPGGPPGDQGPQGGNGPTGPGAAAIWIAR